MPQVDLTEDRMTEVVIEAIQSMRLPIDNNDQRVLAREIYSRYVPNQEEFQPNEEIVYMHGYDYKEYPPCDGRVIAFPKGSVRVEIEYRSTLWDKNGELVRAFVFPNQLRKKADSKDGKDKR